MSVTNRPWFYTEALRAQFSCDVTDALLAGEIDARLSRWLQTLTQPEQTETMHPRVDRLIRDDGVLIDAELAGALLISDPVGLTADAFLYTPLFGLERFTSRQQLLTQLLVRFVPGRKAPKQLEYERIVGDVFESSMLSIIDQQAEHVQQLTECLKGLPGLRTALGETLQQNVNMRVPEVVADVFTHLALIKTKDNAAVTGRTLGTQPLIDVAINSFANTPLPDGVHQQLVDMQGKELTADQARPWEQAFGGVKSELLGVHEKLLADYWSTQDVKGASHLELICEGFAERFRQQLLEHRHQGFLASPEYTRLKSLCIQGDRWMGQVRVSKLSVAIARQDPVKLAGIFIIEQAGEPLSDLFLYSSTLGFQRFKSVTTVTAYFAGIDARTLLFGYSSLNDHPLLRTVGEPRLRLDPVEAAPLMTIVKSVIALQKRDLGNVLAQAFKCPAEAAVTLMHAIDIRDLIDPRLTMPGHPGRWNETMAMSERNWASFNSPSRIAALGIHFSKDSGEHATLPWAMWLRDVRIRLDDLFEVRPTVVDCARRLLNRYMAVLHGEPIDAQRMWFRDEEGAVVSLSVLLLERITGCRESGVPEDCAVYVDSLDTMYSQALSWLTPLVLDHVLTLAQQAFAQEYSSLIQSFRAAQLRVGVSAVVPAHALCLIREGLLRLDLNMHRNSGKVSDAGLGMLEQVLDRPVSSLRKYLGAQATEIYIPTLTYDSNQPPVTLTNTMVLHQPLNADCRPLLWSAVLGLREFDSLQALQIDLETRLVFAGSRDRWLKLVARPEREKIQACFKQGNEYRVTSSLGQVDGHFIEQLEVDEVLRQCEGIDAAYRTLLAWQAEAGLLEKQLAVMERDDAVRTIIDTVSEQIELTLLSWHLPDWLKDGSTEDLITFRQLLVRFAQLYNSLRPITKVFSQTDYAAAELSQALQKDFPGVTLNPDRITVTLTRYTVAPGGVGEVPSSVPAATNVIKESLTHYAINRFSGFQDAMLSVSSDDATPLPEAFNAGYIRELVRRLDTGASYERYLNEAFSETAPDYADRLNQFAVQAPCAMSLVAFEQKMQGTLTRPAYDFVENVISMPDGLARLPVNGQKLTFSPLKLVAAEGYLPDVVEGVFLIAPTDQSIGPWILHAVAAAEFVFKEYPGKDELLTDLYTCTKLQALVLERLDPKVRFVYERDGFMMPHLSWATGGYSGVGQSHPGPVQLSIEPIQENVVCCLFRAAQQVMLILARKRSVTTAEEDKASTRLLLLLGLEQVLMFLPGRVGGLMSMWQAQDLLNASLASASHDKWGRATAEFIGALALLISARQQSEEVVAEDQQVLPVAGQSPPQRWHDPQLQFDPSGRLQAFEVHDVSLSNLERNIELNLYRDPVTLRQYAAIFGKVYRVRAGIDGWSVFEGARTGPGITLDADKQWGLDTVLGIRRDGGALTRLRSVSLEMDINDILLVEARGIPEIQRLYPRKATEIVEANDRARYYLENALNNLIVSGPKRELDPRAARIIKDFFGVNSLADETVLPIRKAFTEVYSQLLDPSHSPHSSPRYVVGTNKVGYEDSTAFNFQRDPLHRIFFTERYFKTPYVRIKSSHMRQGGFNTGAHFRAAILIHEMSHIASGTHDIAYVDSSVPFLDLLEDAGPYRARLKREYQQAQCNLSHMTPRDKLFRMDEGDAWRDLKAEDGDAMGAILKLTRTSSLEAARDKFLQDSKVRAQIILSNADSVALLVTLLGRERF